MLIKGTKFYRIVYEREENMVAVNQKEKLTEIQFGCGFRIRKKSSSCMLLEAVGKSLSSDDQRSYLKNVYCDTSEYPNCPVRRQFEKGLAKAELRFEYPLVA